MKQEKRVPIRYDVYSPDGFQIDPDSNYKTMNEAKKGFRVWKKRFKKQGFYSSNYGRIQLSDLADECRLVEIYADFRVNLIRSELANKREGYQHPTLEKHIGDYETIEEATEAYNNLSTGMETEKELLLINKDESTTVIETTYQNIPA